MEEALDKIHTEHLGIHSLNRYAMHNSSARNAMFGSHLGQRLVIEGADESIIQTGIEQDFAKYTFSIKMPVDARVIKVIQKYPKGIDIDSLSFNPETLVIYENDQTKEIDYVLIPYYASHHQLFGYKHVIKDSVKLLKTGAFIPKDTIFADTPSVTENNGFCYGVNLNTAFTTIPSVSEDGIMIADDVLDKLKFRVYETRIVEVGSNYFPLNMYGESNRYQPFPEIGSEIRKDGILMMLRSFTPETAPVDMSSFDLMEPDNMFDTATYVRGHGGKIVDIEVISNNNLNKNLPDGMKKQLNKYRDALLKYKQEIVDTYKAISKEHKSKFGDANVRISPKLNRLMVECLAILNYTTPKIKNNLQLLYRKAPLNEYRIKFVVEYVIKPTIGFKITCTNGGSY